MFKKLNFVKKIREKQKNISNILKHTTFSFWIVSGMSVVLLTLIICGEYYFFKKNILEYKEIKKIGFVTDFEYGYKNNIQNKLTNKAPEELQKVVDFYNNEFKPDIVISGGDMVESSMAKKITTVKQLNEINAVFSKLTMRREYLFGNHDLRNLNKEEVRDILGMDSNYKYVDMGEWRLGLLDTNFNGKGEDKGPSFYAGSSISNDEFTWLREILSVGRPTILFSHHPPYPQKGKNMANGERLRKFLEEFQNVVLVVSGHDPDFKFNTINGVSYLTVDNLANIDSLGSFATLEVKFNKFTRQAEVKINHYGPQRKELEIKKKTGKINYKEIFSSLQSLGSQIFHF